MKAMIRRVLLYFARLLAEPSNLPVHWKTPLGKDNRAVIFLVDGRRPEVGLAPGGIRQQMALGVLGGLVSDRLACERLARLALALAPHLPIAEDISPGAHDRFLRLCDELDLTPVSSDPGGK